MELGTGIFLSALVIAVVMLYSATKDRWKWRRLVKRTLLVILGLLLVGSAAGVSTYYYQQIPSAVVQQTEYAGLRLGMTVDEVLYVKGEPTSVVTDEEVTDPKYKGFYRVVATKEIEAGKSVRDFRYWSYALPYRNLNVRFNNERTAVVAIHCYSEDRLGRCPSIAGIDDGDSESQVLAKLGRNPRSSIDGVTKTMLYPELGIKLQLTKEEVYALEVRNVFLP